ncbi:MAG: hypothetical protein NTV51_04555 [Verrucomicrobia bacterium]|nr:hypothetical protein [Verrucomicrobiota bacterium]
MRRSSKIKIAVARVLVRKPAAAVTTPMAPRRVFPTWIPATGRASGPAAATAVTSRVRDGLVLRVVVQQKPAHVRNLSHGSGAR